MKKTTIILIGVIYLASIILVGVYGLQYKTFNQIVYSTDVEVINPTDKYVTLDSGERIKAYIIKKDPETGLRQFQIEWRVEPIETVTNKNVRFIYTDDPRYTVDTRTGLVEFYAPAAFVVTVVPDDNSNCYDKIIIYCLD